LKDPGTVTELVSMVELGVIRSPIGPEFVNDFEPAVAESPQGAGMTLILLAVVVVVALGPDTTGQTLLRKKMNGVPEMFVTSPTLMNRPVFSQFA
jgi:hypothetical protein